MSTVAQQAAAAHRMQSQVVGEDAPTASVFVFARTLGATQRKTLADSEPLHKAYIKASDEGRKAMKFEFMVGFVSGALGQAKDAAETVINGRVRFGAQPTVTKPERTKEQQKAYDSARKMFSFHITRDDTRITSVNVRKIRLSAAFKQAAFEFIEQFYQEVNAASINEIIRQLQALKTRLPKIQEEAEAASQ